MKKLTVILIFAFSISYAQNQTEINTKKLLGKWSLEKYGNTSKSENVRHIQKTSGNDTIWVMVNDDYTIDITYSETKKEKYKWKINEDTIQIKAINGDADADVVGNFEMAIWKNATEIALFPKDKSLRGVKLKR